MKKIFFIIYLSNFLFELIAFESDELNISYADAINFCKSNNNDLALPVIEKTSNSRE